MNDPAVNWMAVPLDHRVENLTTARLERLTRFRNGGTETVGTVVAKTIRPASESPMFAAIPPAHHAQVLEDLHWLDEPDVYRSDLGAQLPHPMRMPTIHDIVTDSPTSITIVMEEVADVTPWDLARYQRTAEALGALGGRWSGEQCAAQFGLHGREIARMFFGKIMNLDLPIQAADDFWNDPQVAEAVDDHHRRDLLRMADAMPRLLERMSVVPDGVCHGDASPDNFREPGDDTIVAIDWSYGHVGPLGSDLGQLLVGRFETGAADADEVESIAATVIDGYCSGLDRSGCEVDRTLVETAWAVHLGIRSVFSALVLDHRPDLTCDERLALLIPRARVARYGIDMALRIDRS